MSQSVILPPSAEPTWIVKHRAKLLHLSLTREQLHTFPFTPKEPWPKFFEYRLRPMIYLLHSAVTHDFSLVGAHGTYTLMEMKEIKFWIGWIMLHLVSGAGPLFLFFRR